MGKSRAMRLSRNAREIVATTELPVSADLENCFGDEPEVAAETIRLAGETGLVGGSIEDYSGRIDRPIYELEHAAERVRAAAKAAHTLPFAFTLTARTENYLHGRPDIKDTIRRLQAFQEAGADVLYAPGLITKEDIAAVVSSVDRPVNVVMELRGVQLTLAELSAGPLWAPSFAQLEDAGAWDFHVREGCCQPAGDWSLVRGGEGSRTSFMNLFSIPFSAEAGQSFA